MQKGVSVWLRRKHMVVSLSGDDQIGQERALKPCRCPESGGWQHLSISLDFQVRRRVQLLSIPTRLRGYSIRNESCTHASLSSTKNRKRRRVRKGLRGISIIGGSCRVAFTTTTSSNALPLTQQWHAQHHMFLSVWGGIVCCLGR